MVVPLELIPLVWTQFNSGYKGTLHAEIGRGANILTL
jgi:hypothetical protein